jgi:hypothetical protein
MRAIDISDPRQLQSIRATARELEAFAKGPAQHAVARRLAYYTRLCAMAGPSLSTWIGAASVEENQRADTDALNFARSVRLLDQRRMVLVPWQSGAGSAIRFAVASADASTLEESSSGGLGEASSWGMWSILGAAAGGITLFLLAPETLIIGAGVYLADAYLSYKKAEALAAASLARTQENMSNALALAQKRGDKPQVAAILAAMQSANAAAANTNPGWMDSILGTLKKASGAAFEGAGAILLVLLLVGSMQRGGHR